MGGPSIILIGTLVDGWVDEPFCLFFMERAMFFYGKRHFALLKNETTDTTRTSGLSQAFIMLP